MLELSRLAQTEPMSMALRSCEMGVRAGDKYRLVFGDDPANPMAFFGKYLEVVPDKRIVWMNEESGDAGSVTTVTFEERGSKTLPVMSRLYPMKETLDAAGTGSQEAIHETFGQLEERSKSYPRVDSAGGELG